MSRKSLAQRQKALKSFDDRQNQIEIKDWAGNTLYKGHKDALEVDRCLKRLRCTKCLKNSSDDCSKCMGTGYEGEFTVEWVEQRDENVYEHINY